MYASCFVSPAIERIANSPIKINATDSIDLPEEKKIDKITQISVGPLIGEAIRLIHEDKPVSPLFNNRFSKEEASRD